MNDFIKYKDFFSPASSEKPAFDEIIEERLKKSFRNKHTEIERD